MAGLYIAPKSVYMLGYEFVKKLAEEHRVLVKLTIEHSDGTFCTEIIDCRDPPNNGATSKVDGGTGHG